MFCRHFPEPSRRFHSFVLVSSFIANVLCLIRICQKFGTDRKNERKTDSVRCRVPAELKIRLTQPNFVELELRLSLATHIYLMLKLQHWPLIKMSLASREGCTLCIVHTTNQAQNVGMHYISKGCGGYTMNPQSEVICKVTSIGLKWPS